ncbi:acyltransferase [Gryllotalpicola protaetiae]|uniref:Acyltransferase n=1 Tax=Gryllotalpicola protaetiae TaxID=2419771 RepID=A0A387BN96_9MICO|nr:hypothetical protein D7I44_11980 [Gryllotalpicola protaetiae]
MVDVGARIVVGADASLLIGDDTYIGKNATLSAFGTITIGSKVLLGENVSIHTEDHGPPNARLEYKIAPVAIGNQSWLGAGVVVTRGVAIGKNATIGANAVVTHDVPADAVAAGVPARIIRSAASDDGEAP